MLAALLAGRFAESWAALLALWFTLGLANAAVLTPTGRLLRRSVHAEQRPALFTAQFALSHAAWLVAYPLAGWLGAAAGLGVTALVLGLFAGGCTALAMVLWPAGDPVEVEHTHGPHTHEHPHVHDEHHQHHHDGWDGREPHVHPHRHGPLRHRHAFVIDDHHAEWPRPT